MKRIFAILLAAVLLLPILPSASAEDLTVQQEAVVQTAIAYFMKGASVQYDSVLLTERPLSDGGVRRSDDYAAPEEATPDHTVYTVCSSYTYMVYLHALGYDVGHGGKYATTEKMFDMTGDIVVMKYDSGSNMTMSEALEKLHPLVQPGDIFVYRKKSGTGHAMLCVGDLNGDGEPELLHSNGTKYVMLSGKDNFEFGGAIYRQNASSMMSERFLQDAMVNGFILLRPLAADAKDCAPTAAALQRIKYPWFSAERTVSCGYYGSPATGDDLTYTIKLTNRSSGDYTVPVTETVPEGTALKEAPDAQISGSDLSWNVPLAAGESKSVSYTVTVTAPRGTVITAGGGTAAGIESNTLYSRVSGKQPDAAKLQDVDAWAAAVNAETPKGVEFANAVYRHALGVDLRLPSVETLTKACFKSDGRDGWTRITSVPAEQGDYNAMLVDRHFGGRLVLDAAADRALELRVSYLDAGDVFIAGADMADREPTVLVSTGKDVLAFTDGGVTAIKEPDLIKLFASNVFFCLRPSLAYDDITQRQYDPTKIAFDDVAEADWFYGYVTELAQKGVVSGMTATTFAPRGTLTYGQALKLIAKAVGEEDQPAGAHWASGYLELAKNKGWLTEDPDLNAAVTRLALCKIAAKAKGLTAQPQLNPFTDTDDPDVLALNAAGIVSGMTETTFEPDGLLTRAQISKIISLMMKA